MVTIILGSLVVLGVFLCMFLYMCYNGSWLRDFRLDDSDEIG
mgnify:CR=1 FL=1